MQVRHVGFFMICCRLKYIEGNFGVVDILLIVTKGIALFIITISDLVPILVVAIIIIIIIVIVIVIIVLVAILADLRPILVHAIREAVVLLVVVVHLLFAAVCVGQVVDFVHGEVTCASDLFLAGDVTGPEYLQERLLHQFDVVLTFAHVPHLHVRP